jgi:hypothetical protein
MNPVVHVRVRDSEPSLNVVILGLLVSFFVHKPVLFLKVDAPLTHDLTFLTHIQTSKLFLVNYSVSH